MITHEKIMFAYCILRSEMIDRIPDKMPQDKMPQIRHRKNATGQNATKRKPDKMPQNKNTSKL